MSLRQWFCYTTSNELIENCLSASRGLVYRDSPFWLPVPDETSVIATATRLEFPEGARNTDRPYHGTGLSACSSVDERQRARITSYAMSPSRFVRR